jgi:hypothetical protein
MAVGLSDSCLQTNALKKTSMHKIRKTQINNNPAHAKNS